VCRIQGCSQSCWKICKEEGVQFSEYWKCEEVNDEYRGLGKWGKKGCRQVSAKYRGVGVEARCV